ncbi:MAG: DUF5752 family protein [bacterium]
MPKNRRKTFKFHSETRIVEITGRCATDLRELAENIETAPDPAIFYHTLGSLMEQHFLTSGFRNDFAWWVSDSLNEDEVGERLAGIDILSFTSLRDLRGEMACVIRTHLAENDDKPLRKATDRERFEFCATQSFTFPIERVARNLEEFSNHLRRAPISSIFFHFIQSRLRLNRLENDFSYWLRDSLGMPDLAKKDKPAEPLLLHPGTAQGSNRRTHRKGTVNAWKPSTPRP